MDIHKLRCVVSLAKLRNVTRAAEENYVAQSTMSATISSIEAELGYALFTRTNRSITMTRAGEVFVAAAEDILKRYDGALDELRRLHDEEGPQLVIGFNTVSTGPSIAEITLPFQRSHPEYTVRLVKHSLTKLSECLAQGGADIVFCNQFEARRMPDSRFVVIAETRPCVYLPKRHPLTVKRSLTLQDLEGEMLFCACTDHEPRSMSAAAEALQAAGVPYSSGSLTPNEETIFSMVESGLGLYPASTWYQHAFKDRVACRPLDITIENMQIVIMWRDPAWDDLANDLASHARKIFLAQRSDAIDWEAE